MVSSWMTGQPAPEQRSLGENRGIETQEYTSHFIHDQVSSPSLLCEKDRISQTPLPRVLSMSRGPMSR